MHPILASALSGFSDSFKLLTGSAASFFVANIAPEESLFKVASGVTGWALAMATIYVLVKTVRVLFAKLESKDDMLRQLLEKQRDELKHELEEREGK